MRRSVAVASAVIALVGGFAAGRAVEGSAEEVPVVVVDVAQIVTYDMGEISDEVAEAGRVLQAWGEKHPENFAGVVHRQEGAFIGLLRDHEEVLRSLQEGQDAASAMKAFRAKYTLEELEHAVDELIDFVGEDPHLLELLDRDGGSNFVIREDMNAALYAANFPPYELVRAIQERFDDRVRVEIEVGRLAPAHPVRG